MDAIERDNARILLWQRTGRRDYSPVTEDDRCDSCGAHGYRGLCKRCDEWLDELNARYR